MEPAAYGEFRDLERTHWWFRGRRAIFLELLKRRVLPALGHDPVRSLDLGCGMGGHLTMLRGLGEPVGTDVEIEAVRHCRTRGFQRVVLADGARLPFKEGAFDLVTAFDTIEHIEDDLNALKECCRVLRPGGFLFLSGPAYQFLYTHQDAVVHHQRRYTTGRLKRLFEAAGFHVDHKSYINSILFPPILAALLLIKLKQLIVPPGADDKRSNASIWFPGWLNEILAGIFASERHLASRFELPFGHSLLVVGRKL
jgi:SAM-dependent methyltransferase